MLGLGEVGVNRLQEDSVLLPLLRKDELLMGTF